MNPSTLERAAYLAAHRIIQSDLSNPQFACPGTRPGIIKDVMEAEGDEELAHLHRYFADSIEARAR